MKDKKLLLLGSGSDRYRKYIMEAAVAMGVMITLLTDKEVAWEDKLCEKIIFADLKDSRATYDRLRYCAGDSKFDGIMTYDEELVIATAELAQMLSLPFISRDAAVASRDKYIMRERFEANGVRVPAFRKVWDAESYSRAIEEIGLPAVIKPVDGHSSIGVMKIESAEDAAGIFETISKVRIHDRSQTEFIVEEYLSGNEVSVESVVFDGEVFIFGITQKYTTNEPYFEEVGHSFPAVLPEELKTEINAMVRKGIRALGINIGATHCELRLTPKGPTIVEIGARLGGDKIPYLVDLATGANIAAETVKAALGIRPQVTRKYEEGAAIRFIIPQKSGRIIEYPELGPALSYPGVHELSFKAKQGLLKLPPEGFFTRFGFIVTRAGEPAEAYRRALEAEKLLNLNIV